VSDVDCSYSLKEKEAEVEMEGHVETLKHMVKGGRFLKLALGRRRSMSSTICTGGSSTSTSPRSISEKELLRAKEKEECSSSSSSLSSDSIDLSTGPDVPLHATAQPAAMPKKSKRHPPNTKEQQVRVTHTCDRHETRRVG
jgi:hypothetical protein